MAVETEEKSFLDYLNVIWRRKYLIIAIVVALVALSIGVDDARAKVYGAPAIMQLVSQNVAQGGGAIELSTTDIATDIQLISSAAVKAIVTANLNQPAPNVAVSEVGLTAVVNVSVSSTNLDFAVRAANEYVNAYIQFTTQRYAQQTKHQETALTTQRATLESEISTIEQQIAASTPSSSSNSGLTTELQVYAAQLEQVNTSLSQLQLDQTLVASGGLLVTPATASNVSVSPKRTTDAVLGAFLGLIIGIGLALLLDFLDDRIRSKEHLHAVTSRLPLLGEIPKFDNWKHHSDTSIVAAERPKSAAAEAYRSLRTAIQFIGFDSERAQVIQITSPMESEGKTTTVIDLAVTMASSGTRVAIVSCDLRKPGIHKFFKTDNSKGLSSVLGGTETLQSVFVAFEELPNLICIPSGPIPPNPSELLGSTRLSDIFEALRATNDVILVDSPPVLPVTDAIVVAQVVDFVVLVARAELSHARAVSRALELLSNVDAPVRGVILNAVEVERSRRGYGRYGAYGNYGSYA